MKRSALVPVILCLIAMSLVVAAIANAYMAPTPQEERESSPCQGTLSR